MLHLISSMYVCIFNKGIDTLASFSSIGPADTARIKPDILSPGDIIISARASGQLNNPHCGTGLKMEEREEG